MLLTAHLKLFLVCSTPFFVSDKLLEQDCIHLLPPEPLGFVNLNSIDLDRGRIDHFVKTAVKVAFCKDHFPLELLAVMAEAQIVVLVSIEHLKLLKLFKF